MYINTYVYKIDILQYYQQQIIFYPLIRVAVLYVCNRIYIDIYIHTHVRRMLPQILKRTKHKNIAKKK